MSLQRVCDQLDWPKPNEIFNPPGSGPSFFAQVAREKLGRAISNAAGFHVNVGVLMRNPAAPETEAPIAVVCEFERPASPQALFQTHKLAWNFCRAPLLLIVEPHQLRAWTCWERPAAAPASFGFGYDAPEILHAPLDHAATSPEAAQALRSLRWLQLASGQFFKDHAERFKRDGRADRLLLENLKSVRRRLRLQGLTDEVVHNLLARIIFIQFLFDRKDSEGNAALSAEQLRKLYDQRELSARYQNLAEVLANKFDTYRLFRWLNEKFNGDLFPSGGEQQSGSELKLEMTAVTQAHLNKLAEFVSGRMRMSDGQQSLWQMYSFDTIPLEFISSIYEEFVTKETGVHYTKGYLVDLVLDFVLPWDDAEWDVSVLDPACGSGIFLVKVYQRLVHRWRRAHGGAQPDGQFLQRLLTRNLFGVDIAPDAVKVASFSLYLAMCDEINPRRLLEELRFPKLRGKRLIQADFFREDVGGFRTGAALKYDLVVGNAPWGQDTATDKAVDWAGKHGWKMTYKSVGPLFLAKAAALTKRRGKVAMIQPALALLYNNAQTARELREKLFRTYKVSDIINLSALRQDLFEDAKAAACLVALHPTPPDGRPINYICPKPVATAESGYKIIIEPPDIHWVFPEEAATDWLVWSVLMWGGRRDLDFIRRLARRPSIVKLEREEVAKTREGIIRGGAQRKRQEAILDRPILEANSFPPGTFLHLDPGAVPVNLDPLVHIRDSTDFSAFQMPQLIIKQALQESSRRFQAALTAGPGPRGVICSQSYISVHVPGEEHYPYLAAACLTYNSKLATYYVFHTSGRVSSDRPEARVEDLLNVPLPQRPARGVLEGVTTPELLESRVREMFAFQDADWALIDDLIEFTFPVSKNDKESPGFQRTRRAGGSTAAEAEPDLEPYCDYFLRVLKAGFGTDKNVCATVFREANGARLPVRLVAVHLDAPGRRPVEVADYHRDLQALLAELNDKFLSQSGGAASGDILYRRVAKVYDRTEQFGPTLYFVKPDERRYWTRSQGLRDADEVAADIIRWKNSGLTSDIEQGAA